MASKTVKGVPLLDKDFSTASVCLSFQSGAYPCFISLFTP